MPVSRRYDDPCGIARALDVVGDRWALLVVRELMFGPKRFVQLRAGLPGISPNVLSQRLRDLAAAGIVRADVLDAPASVGVYELTGRGRALEPVLLELGRWGSGEAVTTSAELSVSGLLVALKTVFDPRRAVDAVVSLRIGGSWYQVTTSGDSIEVTAGRPPRPDVAICADAPTMRAVVFGREPVARAERAGRLTVQGNRDIAEAFVRMFPARSAAGPVRRS